MPWLVPSWGKSLALMLDRRENALSNPILVFCKRNSVPVENTTVTIRLCGMNMLHHEPLLKKMPEETDNRYIRNLNYASRNGFDCYDRLPAQGRCHTRSPTA